MVIFKVLLRPHTCGILLIPGCCESMQNAGFCKDILFIDIFGVLIIQVEKSDYHISPYMTIVTYKHKK